MSKTLGDVRLTAKRRLADAAPVEPAPHLAKGTRNGMQPMSAEDVEEHDEEHVLEADAEHVDHVDLSADDASIAAHMLELGKRRFNISQIRPGQALAIRNELAGNGMFV